VTHLGWVAVEDIGLTSIHSGGGASDRETRPGADHAVDLDSAVKGLDDGSDDRQAQAAADPVP
jgi:hypothetical protein